MKLLSDINKAYIAGIIDGEGCISISRTSTSKSAKGCKRGYAYRSSIRINMTYFNTIKWIKDITGIGQLHIRQGVKKNHKPSLLWVVWSNEASEFAKVILPYLQVKKEQAKNLIEFQDKMRYPGTKGLTEEEWLFRESSYNYSKQLNQRGVSENNMCVS